MEKIIISGKEKLCGDVNIGGMKNSALPIIFACLLVKDECIIENVPFVSDTVNALEILRGLGAEASFCDKNTVRINTNSATNLIKDQDSFAPNNYEKDSLFPFGYIVNIAYT